MGEHKTLKTIPVFHTDAEAEQFVEEADLTESDLSGFTRTRFAFDKPPTRRLGTARKSSPPGGARQARAPSS